MALAVAIVCILVGSVTAQNDPFGTVDRVWVGSVGAAPGEQVQVGIFAQNDEPLGSLSIPLTFDPNLLKLVAVDFAGSRGEYIATKLVSPADVKTANGHFLTGLIVIHEDPIPAGEGLLFTAIFEVADSAADGEESTLDSLFFPPGGELILVEATTAAIIQPEFTAGKVTVETSSNRAPAFASIPVQYLNEGDSLNLKIIAADPDGDPITISCVTRPSGALFSSSTDGEGILTWKAEFTGPNSSAGSPHNLIFRVTDSKVSETLEVPINVIDLNRHPVLAVLEPITIDAGDSVTVSLTATDPDFDSLAWTISGQPEGVSLNPGSPALLNWQTTYADTGLFDFEIIVTDPHGYADSTSLQVIVLPTTVFTLAMDTVAGDPGEIVNFSIFLINEDPVAGFELLVHHDPTVLSPLSLIASGTRAEDFEYFTYEFDYDGNPGNVSISGIANVGMGGATPPIGAGSGAICIFSFKIAGSVSYSGMTAPVTFEFSDGTGGTDNTMTRPDGVRIEQSEITYLNGYVYVYYLGDILLGDINLNGLAPEIGDAIYFSNYFMDPIGYNLNPLQVANSDVNSDGLFASIADLVTLINMIVQGAPAPKSAIGASLSATVTAVESDDGSVFEYDTDFEIGALYVVFRLPDGVVVDPLMVECESTDMTLAVNQIDTELRILTYSLDANRLPSGSWPVLHLNGLSDLELKSVEMADSDGRLVEVTIVSREGVRPDGFALHQNYPNPFNPETTIEFDLGEPSYARLVVFNVMGQKVKILSDRELPAGNHSVTWDGTDQMNQTVSSGVYLYRLETDLQTQSRKMMLLK